MKRAILILLSALMILCLTSCREPVPLKTDFSAAFTVSQNETEYKGELELNSDNMHIKMLEPYSVEGIEYNYGKEGLDICLGEHIAKVNCDYIPSSAIPSVLHNTLSYISTAEHRSTEGGYDRYDVSTPYGVAVIKAAEGFPLEMKDPYSGLSFIFEPVVN